MYSEHLSRNASVGCHAACSGLTAGTPGSLPLLAPLSASSGAVCTVVSARHGIRTSEVRDAWQHGTDCPARRISLQNTSTLPAPAHLSPHVIRMHQLVLLPLPPLLHEGPSPSPSTDPRTRVHAHAVAGLAGAKHLGVQRPRLFV